VLLVLIAADADGIRHLLALEEERQVFRGVSSGDEVRGMEAAAGAPRCVRAPRLRGSS